MSKIDEKLLFARQLKHNICGFEYDFLGRYKIDKEEAEKLKEVLDDYILLVGMIIDGQINPHYSEENK